MADHKILPVFVPHGGCPHRCVFCDQRQITGCDRLPLESELASMLPTDLSPDTEIAFYGGSFTAIGKETRKKYLSFAFGLKEKESISRIRVSTHPAYIDDEIIEELVAYGVDTVELGIQSTDDDVLRKAKRGHGSKEVFSAVEKLARSPLKWGAQLMVGLPGDSAEKCIRSVADLLPYHPDMARIYPVLVLRGTELAELMIKKEYEPLSVGDAVCVSGRMFALFSYASVPVIRMGLQPTDEIRFGSDTLMGGPFHPSFGYLVKSDLKEKQMCMLLKNHSEAAIRILAPKKELPLIFGDHSKNIASLGEDRTVAVSEADLPLGAVALAPYDKKKKQDVLAVLSWQDFLEDYTKQDRSIYCI